MISLHQLVWSTATLIGTRRVFGALAWGNSALRDTTFFFSGLEDTVALTIDDGLARNGASASMVRARAL